MGTTFSCLSCTVHLFFVLNENSDGVSWEGSALKMSYGSEIDIISEWAVRRKRVFLGWYNFRMSCTEKACIKILGRKRSHFRLGSLESSGIFWCCVLLSDTRLLTTNREPALRVATVPIIWCEWKDCHEWRLDGWNLNRFTVKLRDVCSLSCFPEFTTGKQLLLASYLFRFVLVLISCHQHQRDS